MKNKLKAMTSFFCHWVILGDESYIEGDEKIVNRHEAIPCRNLPLIIARGWWLDIQFNSKMQTDDQDICGMWGYGYASFALGKMDWEYCDFFNWLFLMLTF